MLANDGELEGKCYLSHAAMEELRKEETWSDQGQLQSGVSPPQCMFGHDGAYGTDLSVDQKDGNGGHLHG